jgi:glycosyltransferase involved in cell wall biosynthesis
MTPASVACVIPALDAARTLPAVIAGVRAAVPRVCLIGVDDGSRDDTREVLRRGCDRVIAFDQNRGKGTALRAAFALALELGADVVLTVDADGQHDTSRAGALLAALDGADIVIGARQRSGSRMPIHRRVSNAVSSAAISWAAGCPVPDSQSGFRAIRAAVLNQVQPMGERYEFETELVILAARAGFRISAVPIPTIYGSRSHFRPLSDSVRVLLSIWRHRRRAT